MTRPAPVRKPRARSQARIDSILDAARTLLAAEGVASLSIYSVAERAQIPPSSVYHFFASVPALLEALTADVHAAFRACLQAPIDHDALRDWRDLSRLVEERMLEIYGEDAAARQLILAQHGLTEVTQADRQHDLELGDLMHKLFDHHFELPRLPDDVDVFALAMELGDRVYAARCNSTARSPRAWPKKACGCSMPISGCICRRTCPSEFSSAARDRHKKPRRAHTLRGCFCPTPLQLGDGHLGGFHEGDHFAADLQFQLLDRTGGDHRSDDAGSGLHVDFRQYVAENDLLDRAFELVAYVDGFDSHGIDSCRLLELLSPTQLRRQG